MSRIFITTGPYGTEGKEVAESIGAPEATAPLAVLDRHPLRDEARTVQNQISRAYFQAINISKNGPGAIIQVPSFGDREQIHRPNIGLNGDGGIHTFKKLVETKTRLVEGVLEGTHGALISVTYGPKNDCYEPESAPDLVEAIEFHDIQVAAVEGRPNIHHINWETLTRRDEALGAVIASMRRGVPCIVNFTIGMDGRLLGAETTGETLGDAIKHIDSVTRRYPLGYGINCAPIEGLEPALADARRVVGKREERVISLAPNASSKDVRTLDGSSVVHGVLDISGQGAYLNHFRKKHPSIKILSGCCGNKPKSIGGISEAVHKNVFSTVMPQTDAEHVHHDCSH